MFTFALRALHVQQTCKVLSGTCVRLTAQRRGVRCDALGVLVERSHFAPG